MVAKVVDRWPFGLFAATGYVAGLGAPADPDDLGRLAAIYHSESPSQRWTFREGRVVLRQEIQPRRVVSSQEGCVAAAKAGLGYIYSAALGVRSEVEQGTLLPLLADWEIGT